MINQGIDVPDNTIAIFLEEELVDWKRFNNIVKKPSKKRDWFDKHFYNCLPLTIGNQYGFIITSEYDFAIEWNGGNDRDDMKVMWVPPKGWKEGDIPPAPHVSSHFGHGIVTLALPFIPRTPPGVNLMTINPPNEVIRNATVMTGVVEADNIRMPFTFNLKIHHPNVITAFPAGTPIVGFIPIPRYFPDGFELKNAKDIFSPEIIEEERLANLAHAEKRSKPVDPDNLKTLVEKDYFNGQDVYGNQFPDHQAPSGKKITRQ
jgi:hypothetical protein